MSKLAINGGPKFRETPFAPQQDVGEEEIKLLIEVIDSKELSGFLASPGEKFLGGLKVRELENLWKDYLSVKHVMAVQSATAGLHAAVAALNLGPGDEVLVPSYSMCASATAIVMHNAIPIFVDIDEDTYCIDPKEIKKAITPNTKAIIVVHLFGYPAELEEIMAIAEEHNLKVIEDNAQGPGAIYKGRYTGTIGHIGVFSFNQNKSITTGEGGLVTTNDDELAKRVQLIRNHGEVVVDQYPVDNIAGIIGWNYRMTELEAAVGIAQFHKLNKLNDRRVELAEYLTKKLKQFGDIFTSPTISSHSKHVYFLYPFKFNAEVAGISRNKFTQAMIAEGMPVGAGYVRPIYLEPMYQQLLGYGDKGCPFNCPLYGKDILYPKGLNPVCERMHFEELLLTPICHYPLTEKDIDDFIKAIEKVIKYKSELIS